MAELTLIEKALLLKSSPLFSDLDLEAILPISDKLGPLSVKADRTIFSAGEQGDHVYLIAEGSVRLTDSEDTELARLESGELFGEEALLSGRPRGYSARSSEPTLLLALSKDNLRAVLEECPTVAICLLEAYASQVPARLRSI